MFSLFSKSGISHPKITLVDDEKNPLPPCPDTPNCVSLSYQINRKRDLIYRVVVNVLKQMDGHITRKSRDSFTAQTVFTIFIYKDDVSVSLEENSSGTLLHIRSASRKGHYDFGVNRRRINNFINLLGRKIK